MATSTAFLLRLTTDDHGGVRVHAACTGPAGDKLSDERFVSGPERTQCRVPDLPLHAGIRHVLDTLGAAEPWPDSALRALRAACDGHPAPLHHTAAAVLRAAARLAHARQAARTAGGDPAAHPAAVDAAGRLDAAVAAYERAVAGALPATPAPPPPAGPAGGPRTR